MVSAISKERSAGNDHAQNLIKLSEKLSRKVPVWNNRMLQLMHEAVAKEQMNSQKEWFEMIGFQQANVSGIRTGERSFTVEQMIKAAKFHATTLDYICGLTDQKAKRISPSAIDLIEEGLRKLKEKKG